MYFRIFFVLNRVRVSNPQRLTHTQILVECPPSRDEHMAKNQFQMHILCFFIHADVKMQKTSMKLLQLQKFPFKNVLSLTIEYRMYLKFLPNPRCLGCFKTSQRSVVEFFERQFHSEKLSFVHKKETEHSIELSLSVCVFYRHIFNLWS